MQYIRVRLLRYGVQGRLPIVSVGTDCSNIGCPPDGILVPNMPVNARNNYFHPRLVVVVVVLSEEDIFLCYVIIM